MQGLTRNPLADPGILGVNAGAALFVVIGIYSFGLTSLSSATCGSPSPAPRVASVIVYSLGSIGREGATPVKLALAGAALTALLGSITTAILLVDVDTLDQFRFWIVGSLAGRTATIAASVAPFIAIGLLLALCCAPLLNTLALGDDVARGLGQRVGWSRAAGAVCIVLLCGAATAAAGPIVFVGLAVPHIARAITGPDYRWIMPYSMILAPVLLVGADVIGRVVARPGELQVGIVTAILGAPDLHRPRAQSEDRRPVTRNRRQPIAATVRRQAIARNGDGDAQPRRSPSSSPSACRSASATSRSRSAT